MEIVAKVVSLANDDIVLVGDNLVGTPRFVVYLTTSENLDTSEHWEHQLGTNSYPEALRETVRLALA